MILHPVLVVTLFSDRFSLLYFFLIILRPDKWIRITDFLEFGAQYDYFSFAYCVQYLSYYRSRSRLATFALSFAISSLNFAISHGHLIIPNSAVMIPHSIMVILPSVLIICDSVLICPHTVLIILHMF